MSFIQAARLGKKENEEIDSLSAMLDEYCYNYDDLMLDTKAAWDSSSEAARTLYNDESERWGPNKSVRCFNKVAVGVPAALAVIALGALSPVIVPSYVLYKTAQVGMERKRVKGQRSAREEMRDNFYTGKMMPPPRVTRVRQERTFTLIDFDSLQQKRSNDEDDDSPPRLKLPSQFLVHSEPSDFLDLADVNLDTGNVTIDDITASPIRSPMKGEKRPVLRGIHKSHEKLTRPASGLNILGDIDLFHHETKQQSRSFKHVVKQSPSSLLHRHHRKSPHVHELWRSNRRIQTNNEDHDEYTVS